MVITVAKIDDGYVEQLLHFVSTAAPILRLRAVRDAKGQYIPIVRDYGTGSAMARGEIRYTNPQDCLRAAKNMALSFITESAEKVVDF